MTHGIIKAFRSRPSPPPTYTRADPVKRRAVLFVLLAAAVVLAAWRIGAPSSGKAAGEPSGSLSFEEGSSTGATDATPAALAMSVFTRPRTEADVLPDEYSYRLRKAKGECEGWLLEHDACFGEGVGEESRLVLADLGQTHAKLYAWPTTSGGVCWATGRGMGMCTNHFTGEDSAAFTGWDPDIPETGAPLTFLGVVPDDVVAAQVTVHGIDHDALVEDNGFFYELSDTADTCQPLDSVTIFYRDGTSETIPDRMIGWGWTRPDDAPPPPAGEEPPRC